MGGDGAMRVFVDTNVVVDFLGKREPFFHDAAIIFEMGRLGKIDVVVSALTIVNCAYILRKQFSNVVTLNKIEDFCQMLRISPIDRTVILNALSSRPADYEDAVQYNSAKFFSPDVIITRDKTGFKEYGVLTMSPVEFVNECQKQ